MNAPVCPDHGSMELMLVHDQSGGNRRNFWKCPQCSQWAPARTIEEAFRAPVHKEGNYGGNACAHDVTNPLGDAMRVARTNKEASEQQS